MGSENSENVTLTVIDSFQEFNSLNFTMKILRNYTAKLEVRQQYASQNYFVEIGSYLKMSFSKEIFYNPNSNIRLNYSFILKDKLGIQQNFLILDQDLNLVSIKSIDDSYLGNYYGSINATDEFLDSVPFNFKIEVNYSVSTLAQIWLQKLAGFISSLASLVAIYKFYYVFFNWWFSKKNESKEETVIVDHFFKRKYAFIQKEVDVAENIYARYKKSIKKSQTPKLSLSKIQEEVKNIMDEFSPKKFVNLPFFAETIECILEGLLIINIIKETPGALHLLHKIKKTVEQKTKDAFGKRRINIWYSNFFFSELSLQQKIVDQKVKKMKFTPLNSFLLQKGKFKIVEKHLTIIESFFEENYELNLKRLQEKNKKLQGGTHMYQLMIKGIILYKRGILAETNPIFLYLNKFFSSINLNCISYVRGDSLYALENDLIDVTCKWKNRNLNQSKFQLMDMKTNFFSKSNRDIPLWLNIEQKNGVLVVKGVPTLGEENKSYKVYFKAPNSKNLFHFIINLYLHERQLDKKLSTGVEMTETYKQLMSNNTINDVERANAFKIIHGLDKKTKSYTKLQSVTSPIKSNCNFELQSPEMKINNDSNPEVSAKTIPDERNEKDKDQQSPETRI